MGRRAHANEAQLKQRVAEKSKCLVVDVERILDAYEKAVTSLLGAGQSVRILGRGYLQQVTREATTKYIPTLGRAKDIPRRVVTVYRESKPR